MSETRAQDEIFPLADIAIEFLVHDSSHGEKMSFGAQGKEGMDAGIEALFASGLPAQPALEGLLGLAFVLERAEASPTAAGLIRDVVAAQPRALRALGLERGDAVKMRRGVARLTGGAEQDRAPVVGSAKPVGALSLASLMDPTQMDRTRAGGAAVAARRAPSPPPKAGSVASRRRFGVS